MDFLGNVPSGMDLRSTLGPAFKDPFSQHCSKFQGLCQTVYDERQELTERISEFVFGSESPVEGMLNDTGAAVRSLLGGLAEGLADSLLGAAPERPAPHSQLIVHQAAGQPLMSEIVQLHDVPGDAAGPLPIDAELEQYDAAWLTGSHFYTTHSDLRVTGAVGSHGEFVAEALEFIDRHLQTLAWLASDAGEPVKFRDAYLGAFPHVTEFAARFMDIGGLEVRKEELEGSTVRVVLEAALNYARAAEHYPHMAELIQLFDPFQIELRHPGTGAPFLNYCMKEGRLHLSSLLRDGQLVFAGAGGGDEVTWDGSGKFVATAVVDCSLVPLGMSLAAIPFPQTTLRCEFDRLGRLSIACISAGEVPLVAGAAFDVDHFRRLLEEGFALEFAHTPARKGRSVIRMFNHFMFPSASVAKPVALWFRDFVLKQIRDLDALQAFADFFKALATDAATFGRPAP